MAQIGEKPALLVAFYDACCRLLAVFGTNAAEWHWDNLRYSVSAARAPPQESRTSTSQAVRPHPRARTSRPTHPIEAHVECFSGPRTRAVSDQHVSSFYQL